MQGSWSLCIAQMRHSSADAGSWPARGSWLCWLHPALGYGKSGWQWLVMDEPAEPHCHSGPWLGHMSQQTDFQWCPLYNVPSIFLTLLRWQGVGVGFKTRLLKIVPLGEEGEAWRAAILLVSYQMQWHRHWLLAGNPAGAGTSSQFQTDMEGMKNNGLHHQDPKAGDIWQYTENFYLSQLGVDAACTVQEPASVKNYLPPNTRCLLWNSCSRVKTHPWMESRNLTICWCG